ncbi:short-chain dehydrogenase [Xylariales sp. PMI_506]|nr:short-chain dehydrogenase [Xylariales sp. PMI_506]
MDSSTLFNVDGMVVVISGGGTGLGLMMARALAGAGAKKVYVLGRRLAALEAAAASHPSIIPLVCDVALKESLQAAVDIIAKEAGYVNLVIANSGIFGPPESFDSKLTIQELRSRLFDQVSMENFTNLFHVNITGAYFTALAFLELLHAGNKNAVEAGGFGSPLKGGSKVPSIQSQIIFTGSVGSFSRQAASPPAYSASKAALVHLAKHAATNLAPYQIRVNAIAPGFFPSEMANPIIENRDPENETPEHEAFMPARRFGTEEELGGSILYLASRAGSYCNGFVLSNDGGRLSVIPSTY